jgi:anti-anti-sigma factor
LEGDLDLLAAEELAKVLLPMCERGVEVELDLAGVGFIDSTGISLLLRSHRSSAQHGGRFVLTGVHGPVERVLHVTGADEILGLGLP